MKVRKKVLGRLISRERVIEQRYDSSLFRVDYVNFCEEIST